MTQRDKDEPPCDDDGAAKTARKPFEDDDDLLSEPLGRSGRTGG